MKAQSFFAARKTSGSPHTNYFYAAMETTGRMTSGNAMQRSSQISGRLPDVKNTDFEYPKLRRTEKNYYGNKLDVSKRQRI